MITLIEILSEIIETFVNINDSFKSKLKVCNHVVIIVNQCKTMMIKSIDSIYKCIVIKLSFNLHFLAG